MLLQEGVGTHNEAGCAVSTLSRAFFGKGFLDGMEGAILGKTLDGQQFRAVGLRCQCATGVDGATVEHDAAAAAIASAANQFCAFEMVRV